MTGRGGDFDISKPTKGEQDHELLTYAEVCRRSAASFRHGALHDHLRTLADLLGQFTAEELKFLRDVAEENEVTDEEVLYRERHRQRRRLSEFATAFADRLQLLTSPLPDSSK